jgi:hypothetical protein
MVRRSSLNILFVTHPYPNYVPDLLLHGLRKLIGPSVVDYPRKDCLYDGVLGLGVCPDDQRCPGWFPDDADQVDRDDIPAKLAHNFFELVVGDVRSLPLLIQLVPKVPNRCAIIDGEDTPQVVKPGPYVIFRRETNGADFSVPLPMALPEEILNWIVRYDDQPKRYSIGFLGSTHDGERQRLVQALSHRYPDSLFLATCVPSRENPSPQGRLGRNRYYQLLQQCRVVLSLAGAGYDTFRFWENAACNAIHAAPVFPLLIPGDFVDGAEIVRFKTTENLIARLDRLLEDDEKLRKTIGEGRLKLFESHLTTHRAAYFIERLVRSYT